MTSGNLHVYSSRGVRVNTAVTKTFYLDAVAGDDEWDGSVGYPVATLARLVELITGTWFQPVVIRVAGGTYDLDELTSDQGVGFIPMSRNACLHWFGEEKTVIASGTVQAGSTAYRLNTSSIGATDRAGYSIEITSGAAVGKRATITESTDITVDGIFATVPAANDTFEIFEPAAVFRRTATVAPNTATLTLAIGPSGASYDSELSRPQKPIWSFTNILFQNSNVNQSNTQLCFTGGVFLFGAMFRDFTRSGFIGSTIAGDSSYGGLKTATTTTGPSSLSALSSAAGLGDSGYIPLWSGWGIGADPALVTTFDFGDGVHRVLGLVCLAGTINVYDRGWLWGSNVRCRRYNTAYKSFSYLDASLKLGIGSGSSGGIFVSTFGECQVAVSATAVAVSYISSSVALETSNLGLITLSSTAFPITGGTYSIRTGVSGGNICFLGTFAATITGDTLIGGNAGVNVLNVKTAAAVIAVQPIANYAAAGDGFTCGTSSIRRVN